MIRPTVPDDTLTLLSLATATGVFKPHEIVALEEVLRDYHALNQALGHRAVTFVDDRVTLGFVYYAPAAMTDRTWYLYWIAVDPAVQAKGIGSQLLAHAEEDIRTRQGRILLVETSSLPQYDPTRAFYRKRAYEQAAVVPDFYADGDSMVVFSKRMS